jgi:hypothetical protein
MHQSSALRVPDVVKTVAENVSFALRILNSRKPKLAPRIHLPTRIRAPSSVDPALPTHQNSGPSEINKSRHNISQLTGQQPASSHIRSQDNFLDGQDTSPPSHCPNVLHTEYTFVDSRQLHSLPSEDLAFLASKDCLTLPGPDAIEEFVEQYFKRIHPLVPVLDEAEFWRIYSSNQTSGPKISLFVLQSLLFASCPVKLILLFR